MKREFGVEIRAVSPSDTQAQILSQGQGPSFVPPEVEGEQINNFWIVNGVDLDNVWSGDTFSMGTTRIGSFTLDSGTEAKTSMLVSELSNYQHLKTQDFEAVRLDCMDAYMLVILPSPGKDLRKFERSLSNEKWL
jgi:hypothetical protein